MKPSIIRHAVKSEHRLTVARYRDIPKTHAAKDVRYLYHCCVYLKRVEEVNIFTKSNCSTDLGLSSLLAKHKKKIWSAHQGGKTARQLNVEYEAVFRRKKILESWRQADRLLWLFSVFAGGNTENILQLFTIAFSPLSTAHVHNYCCWQTDLHFGYGSVKQSMCCVYHGRQQMAPVMLEWISSAERESWKEQELDGWRESMLQSYKKSLE